MRFCLLPSGVGYTPIGKEWFWWCNRNYFIPHHIEHNNTIKKMVAGPEGGVDPKQDEPHAGGACLTAPRGAGRCDLSPCQHLPEIKYFLITKVNPVMAKYASTTSSLPFSQMSMHRSAWQKYVKSLGHSDLCVLFFLFTLWPSVTASWKIAGSSAFLKAALRTMSLKR